jgi:IclR family acetate operon transcriptional repressor
MPFLEELASQSQETAHLAVPSGHEIVYIAKVGSPRAIQMASRVGGRAPMYCTALGKSILAHSPDLLEEIINEGLAVRTPYTIASPEALRQQLESVRSQGFALDNEENELGVRCVASAVVNYTNRVIGAISLSGPASRLSQYDIVQFGPAVREAGEGISRGMGLSTL